MDERIKMVLNSPDKNGECEAIKLELEGLTDEIDARLNEIDDSLFELDEKIDKLTNHADKFDYAIAVASGILTGIIDAVFVGELGLFNWSSDAAKEKFYVDKAKSNEKINGFIEKYAKIKGYKPKDGKGSLKGAISFLENKYPVAQDNIWKGKGFSSASKHHLDDLAHHPTPLGLVSAIVVQFLRISTFSSADGKLHMPKVDTDIKDLGCWVPIIISGVIKWLTYIVENNSVKFSRDVPMCLQNLIKHIHKLPAIIQVLKVIDNWFGHMVSDMGGSKQTAGDGMGVSGMFMSLLKEISMFPPLNATGLPKVISNLYTTKKYTTSKVDLRAEIAVAKEQGMPIIINELIVRTFYFIRHLVVEYKEHNGFENIDWNNVIPFNNRTVERMMTIASGVFTAVDTLDALIEGAVDTVKSGKLNWVDFGKNVVLRLNFVGIGRFAVALGADTIMGLRKGKREKEKLKLKNEALYLMGAKLYRGEELLWVAVKDAEESIASLYAVADKLLPQVSEDLRKTEESILAIERIDKSEIESKNVGLLDDVLDGLN